MKFIGILLAITFLITWMACLVNPPIALGLLYGVYELLKFLMIPMLICSLLGACILILNYWIERN